MRGDEREDCAFSFPYLGWTRSYARKKHFLKKNGCFLFEGLWLLRLWFHFQSHNTVFESYLRAFQWFLRFPLDITVLEIWPLFNTIFLENVFSNEYLERQINLDVQRKVRFGFFVTSNIFFYTIPLLKTKTKMLCHYRMTRPTVACIHSHEIVFWLLWLSLDPGLFVEQSLGLKL